jgi:Hpt domain
LLTALQGAYGTVAAGRMGKSGMLKSQKLQSSSNHSQSSCVVLDVAFLNHATFDDRALRTEILGLFSTQLDVLLDSLSHPQSAESWRYLTHTLKGAAAAVGAMQIASIASVWAQYTFPRSKKQREKFMQELDAACLQFKNQAALL